MIKALLQHHIKRALAGAQLNGIWDCHVRGLHSIMLSDAGDSNRMRMFATTTDHELWRNGIVPNKQSLSVHRHHCDITLIGLFGPAVNTLYNEPIPSHSGRYFACEYTSALAGKKAALSPLGGRYVLEPCSAKLMIDGPVHMHANELHTVFVPQGATAAWPVLEGYEVGPSLVSYTTNPTWGPEGLYRPMSPDAARTMLQAVWLQL